MNNVRKIWENSNINRYPSLTASVSFDQLMKDLTTFRIGGPADLVARPSSVDEVLAVIDLFTEAGVPISLLGGGSNLLVADSGIRGAVLTLSALDGISVLPSSPAGRERSADTGSAATLLVRSGSGASMKKLTEWCADNSLSGLERFAGLPGSVGGAVFMNARCYERSVSDVYFSAEVLHFGAGGCTLERKPFDPSDWDYKKSPFQRRGGSDPLVLAEGTDLVLSVDLTVSPLDGNLVRVDMDKWIADREKKGHYRFPSAGSMFKNNHAFGKPSGQLIDEAGLRGFRIGDAQVAPWHGNIVINAGEARAADVRALVEEVRRRVFLDTGFSLESEVILAGAW